MKKNLIISFIIILLAFNYGYADEITDKEEVEEKTIQTKLYPLKIYNKSTYYGKSRYYTLEDIKEAFVKNNKNIDIKRLDNEIAEYEYENSKESKEDLRKKIRDLEITIADLETKYRDIEKTLAFDNMLPEGHPNKLPYETRSRLSAQSAQLSNSIVTYGENLKSMKENYIMLDLKTGTSELNYEYSDEALEDFIKSEKLSIDIKILDILETNVKMKMKASEINFMNEMLKAQKISYELGYIDFNALMDFESKIKVLNDEFDLLNEDINSKLYELSIISGFERIDGLRISDDFFNSELQSKESNYYAEKYKENSYQFDLIDKQAGKLAIAERDLKEREEDSTDAKIMNAKKRKALIQKESILENIKLGASKLISGYNTVSLEKSKNEINLSEAKRKLKMEKMKYSLGYLSRINYNKSAFKTNQMESSMEILELKLVYFKKMLDAMADGIAQK